MNDTMKIVIVGHVDHGKSTLIGRLYFDTGSLPPDRMEALRRLCAERGHEVEYAFVIDHLQEERDQALTIDTSQTFFRTAKRSYTIIDAPGHKEFLKNMLTGATQAEAAILLLDAKDGIRDQTRRHAFLLGLLNLSRVIVVVNKMDLVEFKEETFDRLSREIRELLGRNGITPVGVIPASAKRGDNFAGPSPQMPWYAGPALLGALDGLEKARKADDLPFRMPVQDIYEADGRAIIAGRVEAGRVAAGNPVVVMPAGTKLRVKRVAEFGREVTAAEAGESTGLELDKPDGAARGMVLSAPDSRPHTGTTFNAHLFWMDAAPVTLNAPLTFRGTTQQIPCRVTAISRRIDCATLEVIAQNTDRLEEHEAGEVTITLDRPAVFEDFNYIPELGRFVMERDDAIVAGGVIRISD